MRALEVALERTCASRALEIARLQTQSGATELDGSDGDSSGEVCRERIASNDNAVPVIRPAEHAFDKGASLVGVLVERVEVFARRFVEDHGQRAVIEQEATRRIATTVRQTSRCEAILLTSLRPTTLPVVSTLSWDARPIGLSLVWAVIVARPAGPRAW